MRVHIRQTLVEDLWLSLHGGMGAIEGHIADLSTCFDVQPIDRNGRLEFAGAQFRTVQVIHYYDGCEIVPSYGRLFERNQICVFITTDAQFAPNQMREFRAKAVAGWHGISDSTGSLYGAQQFVTARLWACY